MRRWDCPDAGPGRARRPATPETEEIGIDAAELTYDKEHNVVIARGNVTITRGVLTLRADEVHYDRTTSIADASGHVVVTDPDTMLQGDVGHIDMNDESGWLEPGGAEFSATGYGLRSTRLEKGMGPRYHIEDGVFTTCHCGGIETPSWSFGGKTTDVKLNGLGWVHGATFRVMDVPVLWFPVLSFPALSDRATGFLMPRFGYSARRGFQFEQPFFWNISKSQDATVAVDVETAARIGLLAEYRYMLSDEARGSFAGGYWNESIRTSKADEIVSNSGPPPVNRWLVLGSAKQPLSKDVDMYFDAFAVSDDTLLREYPELQLDSRHRAAPGERAPHQDASRRDRHVERRPHAGGVGLLPGPDRSPGARPAARPVPPSRGLPSAARQSSGGPARGAGHGLPARRGIRRLPRRRLAEALSAVPGRLRAHGVGQRPAARDDVRPR